MKFFFLISARSSCCFGQIWSRSLTQMAESHKLKPRLQNVPSEPRGRDHRWYIFSTQCFPVYILLIAWAVCAFTVSVLVHFFITIARYLPGTDSHSSHHLLNVWDLSNANASKEAPLNVAELTTGEGKRRVEGLSLV